MFKNTASQKLTVFAFADAGHATLDAGEPVTGDAAQITLKIEQDDDGTQSASNDVNPTEVEDGQYRFDLTQAETNGDKLTFYPESSTAGVQVVAMPSNVIYTRPANFGDLTVTSGKVTVGTNDDKSGYSISGTLTTLDALDTAQDTQHSTTQSAISALNDPTAAAIADAVWVEAIADHSGTTGSTAEALNAAGAAGDPWTTALPGAYGAGSAGNIIGNLNDLSTSDIDARLAAYDAPTNAEMVAQFTTIKGATWSSVTDTLEAIRDRGDSAWITATGFSTHSAADVRSEIDSNSTQLAAILEDTGTTLPATLTTIEGKIDTIDGIVDAIVIDTAEIGAAGAGLTAVPWNASWDTEVQSECADALTAYDPPTRAELTSDIGTVTTAISALNDISTADVNAQVLDVINTDTLVAGQTIAEALRRIGTITSGTVSGAGTGTETFTDWAGSGNTLVITVDASGNRSGVTYN